MALECRDLPRSTQRSSNDDCVGPRRHPSSSSRDAILARFPCSPPRISSILLWQSALPVFTATASSHFVAFWYRPCCFSFCSKRRSGRRRVSLSTLLFRPNVSFPFPRRLLGLPNRFRCVALLGCSCTMLLYMHRVVRRGAFEWLNTYIKLRILNLKLLYPLSTLASTSSRKLHVDLSSI